MKWPAFLRRKPSAGPTTPGFSWRKLPEAMRAEVEASGLSMFGVRTIRKDVPPGRILRYATPVENARLSHVDVADPVWISTYPGTWIHFGAMMPDEDPEHEAWRLDQALRNRLSWTWDLPFDTCAGRRVHIIGNGPSARNAIGNVGPEDRTIVINGALSLRNEGLPVTWWCFGDAMYPPSFGTPEDPDGGKSGQAWMDRLLAQNDLSTVDGIFTAFAYHEIAKRCRSGRTWLGAHTGPNLFVRHIVPRGVALLTLTVSGAVICAMAHLAWRLGAREIVLWGADAGIPGGQSGSDVRHAGLVDAKLEGADPTARSKWYQAEGVDGPYLTTPFYESQRKHLDAVCLFIQDAGVPVWSGCMGARYIGAPKWRG